MEPVTTQNKGVKDIEACLRGVKPFSGCTADQLHIMAKSMCRKHYHAGQVIEDIYDPADTFFIVLGGRTMLCNISWAVTPRGFERVLPREDKREVRKLTDGAHWGEERLKPISRDPRPSEEELVTELVIAESSVETLQLNKKMYSDCLSTPATPQRQSSKKLRGDVPPASVYRQSSKVQ